jgi:hypothetical protein
MHFAPRYLGFGCLPILLAFFGFNPVYWFFVFYLVAHPSFKCIALALLGTAVGAASFQVAAMHCSRIHSAAELGRDQRMRKGSLILVALGSLRGVIPDDLWMDLSSARIEKSPLWHMTPGARGDEVFILVYRPAGPDAPWTPGSAFLGSVGHRVAILRDDPLKAIRAWPRFLLLHELAHVSSEGVALQVVRWRYAMTTLHAVVTVAVLSFPLAHAWFSALLSAAAVMNVQSFLRFERLCESYADGAAFRWLGTDEERRRVMELMAHEADSASKVFGRNHFHTRLWRDRISSLGSSRRVSLFNPRGGTRFDPAAFPFLLASIAAAALGWYSPLPSTRLFWTYAGWCVLCQVAAVALHLWSQYVDVGVRLALRERITAQSGNA